MKLRKWEDLPCGMRVEEVRKYYDSLKGKTTRLRLKRLLDVLISSVLLIVLFPVLIILAILIKKDSAGPAIFRQERVTQYGRIFRICKFRTMVEDAGRRGGQITVKNDMRVTKIGKFLRRYRLDELPQLINVLAGDMTLVGTRPEIPCYVRKYKPKMRATLLLPAGVTSEASIRFKDEAQLLGQAKDADRAYIERVLPEKMKYNLEALMKFSIRQDMKTLAHTVIRVSRGSE